MKQTHGYIGFLKAQEALKIFEQGHFAHLACHNKEDLYLVPISYVFEDGCIYSHSEPGKKIDIMRQNPSVCVQVEEVQDYFHWRSAIAWGHFEELSGDDASRGMRMLIKKIISEEKGPSISELEMDLSAQLERAIIYRIQIKECVGRYESRKNSPLTDNVELT